METVIYKKTRDCEIKGDFYSVSEKNKPLIVYIHGGGLIWGSRSDINNEQIERYNEAGFNVFSIDYRLAPETKLLKIANDIRDVFIWLHESGQEELDYDPEKIAVIGSSAGGYLALLAGTFNTKPKAIISFYGYGDILGDWYTKPSRHFTKQTKVPELLAQRLIQKSEISESPIEKRYAIYLYCRQQGKWNDYVTGLNPAFSAEKLKAYCPVKNIDNDYPPTMLLHGDKDEDVPYEASITMAKALQSSGIDHQLLLIPNGKHLFDQHMQDPLVIDALDQVISFLNKHL